jgi:hypothetical protein
MERVKNIVKTKSEMNSVANYKIKTTNSPRAGNINPMEEVDVPPKMPEVPRKSFIHNKGITISK